MDARARLGLGEPRRARSASALELAVAAHRAELGVALRDERVAVERREPREALADERRARRAAVVGNAACVSTSSITDMDFSSITAIALSWCAKMRCAVASAAAPSGTDGLVRVVAVAAEDRGRALGAR